MEKAKRARKKKHCQQAFSNTTCVPWRMLLVLALADLGFGMIALFWPPASPAYIYVYALCAILNPLLIAVVGMKGSFRNISRFSPSASSLYSGRRFSPFLLILSIFAFSFTQVTFLFYIIRHGQEPPFPSLQYTLFLIMYPLLIVAILLLPARTVSPVARLQIFLDSLIMLTVVTTLCYFFVLAPYLIEGSGTTEAKILAVLDPSFDLVVLFCIILVALRSGEAALRPVIVMLGLALFCIFLAHSSRVQEVLNATFQWVEPLNFAWPPALLLIAGAARTITAILKQAEARGYAVVESAEPAELFVPPGRWRTLFPLILVLAISLFCFLLWLMGGRKLFQSQITILCIGGFIVLMLTVLRQLLALYEIGFLQEKVQQQNHSLSLLNDLLAKQAITDSLTGLPNHRELVMRLDRALEYARQTASTCAVIFIDFDHFKAINDCYGHLVGDAVLREFSEIVTTSLRANNDLFSSPPTDRRTGGNATRPLTSLHKSHAGSEALGKAKDFIIGRWGGEEFVAIVPGVEPAGAFRIAEHIRTLVEHHVFAGKHEVHLTCSLGTATYPIAAEKREELLMRADRAMYTAKRLSRNQTRMAIEPLVLAMGMLGEAPETAEEAEMLAVVESLITALEARDPPTGQHSRRVAALSLKMALGLGQAWPDACIIGMGGLLHDLGKVAMPDSILFKHGKLSAVEVEYMARHPLIGEDILVPLPSLRTVAEIVRTHHEWINGSGYPDGLRGEDIPLGARIVAVADAYDAIISHRVYREGRASSEAIRELSKGAGKQFDPRVVEELDHLIVASPHLAATGPAV